MHIISSLDIRTSFVLSSILILIVSRRPSFLFDFHQTRSTGESYAQSAIKTSKQESLR